MDFKEELVSQFNKYEIALDNTQIEQFNRYYELLIEWNEKINLTAITEQSEVIEKHFIDSILPYKSFKENSSIIDIGSGAGFPGIPLKILRPDLNITLLDSLNKRINFLNIVIDELKLNNIVAIHGRCEDMAKMPKYRECFDYGTARAVAKLNILAEYTVPFIKVNGNFVAYKGQDADNEILESKNAISKLYLKENKHLEFNLNENSRKILIFTKINKTPNIYPRGQNKPRKNPL